MGPAELVPAAADTWRTALSATSSLSTLDAEGQTGVLELLIALAARCTPDAADSAEAIGAALPAEVLRAASNAAVEWSGTTHLGQPTAEAPAQALAGQLLGLARAIALGGGGAGEAAAAVAGELSASLVRCVEAIEGLYKQGTPVKLDATKEKVMLRARLCAAGEAAAALADDKEAAAAAPGAPTAEEAAALPAKMGLMGHLKRLKERLQNVRCFAKEEADEERIARSLELVEAATRACA
jgi:hypothetical protein